MESEEEKRRRPVKMMIACPLLSLSLLWWLSLWLLWSLDKSEWMTTTCAVDSAGLFYTQFSEEGKSHFYWQFCPPAHMTTDIPFFFNTSISWPIISKITIIQTHCVTKRSFKLQGQIWRNCRKFWSFRYLTFWLDWRTFDLNCLNYNFEDFKYV